MLSKKIRMGLGSSDSLPTLDKPPRYLFAPYRSHRSRMDTYKPRHHNISASLRKSCDTNIFSNDFSCQRVYNRNNNDQLLFNGHLPDPLH
jgi:hypothetical protein